MRKIDQGTNIHSGGCSNELAFDFPTIKERYGLLRLCIQKGTVACSSSHRGTTNPLPLYGETFDSRQQSVRGQAEP